MSGYLPHGPAATYLQYHYIVANPQPAARRQLLDDAGDGSAYSALHATYQPLLRTAAATVGFFDFMLADAKSGRLIYGMAKEIDLGASLQTDPYRQTNVAAAVARCAGSADPSATCLEDFASYIPSNGQAIAFMGAPGDRQGRGDRRPGRTTVDRGNRPCRDRQPALASGRVRQYRRGLSRRPERAGPLGPPLVLREPRGLFRRAEGQRRRSRRDRCHPPLRLAGDAPEDRHAGHARRRWPASRAPARSSATMASRRSPRGDRSPCRACIGHWSPRSRRRRPSRRSTGCSATC